MFTAIHLDKKQEKLFKHKEMTIKSQVLKPIQLMKKNFKQWQ